MLAAVEDRLREGLTALGIPADETLVAAFADYLRLLARWNQAFNLTSIRDPLEMVPLHILDSLTVRPLLAGSRILDVGCGAGLPGIPLALTEPSREFTLLDATEKKIRFVRQAIGVLKLRNARADHSRIEDYKAVPPFDTILCRAFAALPDFINGAAHLLAPGGQFLAMKGRLPEAELGQLPVGWQAVAVTPVAVPGLDAERHVIRVVCA